nr:RNA-directed DNA polymerase, eukaryota, nucleotide-binding alpha-beta plait domain protein [Tanacetum cinerariifolium]
MTDGYRVNTRRKRFAFIRFIMVPNLERLVENLCTLWIGSYHLFANQVRFERSNSFVKYTTKAPQLNVPKKNNAQGNRLMGFQQKKGAATSYASAVNGENSQVRPGNSMSLAPVLHSSHEKEEGEINSSTDVGVAETDFMDNSPPSMEH